MSKKIKVWIALSLLPQILLIKWLGSNPDVVEKYYSNGLYPLISKFFRALYGWLPFSLGDLVYAALLFLGIRYLIRNFKKFKTHPKELFINLAMVAAVTYFTFYLLWGINYYRLPLANRLGLSEVYTEVQLVDLTKRLVHRTNTLQFQLTSDSTQKIALPYTNKEVFAKTLEGYERLGDSIPFLKYTHPSIKKSLISTVLTYMGYSGYLNPFTNEAQVNRLLPSFRFPVVTGHEIGHQLGYSAENETNFIGYLVTYKNPDPYFKYAASAYALSYCLGELRGLDEQQFTVLYESLNQGVKLNYEEVNSFWSAYQNPLEPLFKGAFNSFLKANNQAQGIKSYNLVVSLLVAYHLKAPV